MVTAQELGISERVERLPAAANPIEPRPDHHRPQPLGKVPTLITDDGTVLFDSRVICEYLNDLARWRPPAAPGGPRAGARWWSNRLPMASATPPFSARYETAMRPEGLRWPDWIAGQLAKIAGGARRTEARAAGFGDRVDLGTIALSCALGYLDYRFASLAWRDKHPNTAAWFAWFGGRDSMVATRPPPA